MLKGIGKGREAAYRELVEMYDSEELADTLIKLAGGPSILDFKPAKGRRRRHTGFTDLIHTHPDLNVDS